MARLDDYRGRRDFKVSPEPSGKKRERAKARRKAPAGHPIFVVQEHHARRLHYDFRLEMDGVLKSWAVPKGPSLNPKDKRLAVETEDHPLDYANFEGVIPKGEYGAGRVYIWDQGTWEPIGDPIKGFKRGLLKFNLKGDTLQGEWILTRTKRTDEKKRHWLLMKRRGDSSIAMPKAAEHAPPESFIKPQLARLALKPPKGREWGHEVKFDGYRLQIHKYDHQLRILTRNGLDWNKQLPALAQEFLKFDRHNFILDGELVWIDESGRTDFQKLQNSLKSKDRQHLMFMAFDLLYLNDHSLQNVALKERKNLLKALLAESPSDRIQFSKHVMADGPGLFTVACESGLEGIVSKRLDAPYSSGRGPDWIKTKCTAQQEFVIGGFTEPEGSRSHFGALLVGYYDGDSLRYAGKVGTGFTGKSLKEIRQQLKKIEVKRSPFSGEKISEKGVHFVKPEIVAEVSFSSWTNDGRLRAPVFMGIRLDKRPMEITRETAQSVEKKERRAPPRSKIKISNPKKIYYKKEKITKLEVAQYYEHVAEFMLPHLKDRPLSIVRCPEGTAKSCFMQRKHVAHFPKSIGLIRFTDSDTDFFSISDQQGLADLVQLGTIEFHTMNVRKNKLDFPDQFIIDLDPGPGISWNQVKEAAQLLRELLEQLGLPSFVKLTGGKGLHLHVPFRPKHDTDFVQSYSEAVAKEFANRYKGRFVTTMSKKHRDNKIFLDYFRNSRRATAVAPYSLRAKPVSSVAMPIPWGDLDSIPSPDFYTLKRAMKVTAPFPDLTELGTVDLM